MKALGILIVVVAVGLSAFWQIRRDPRMTREVVLRTFGWAATYVLFCAVGVAILLLLVNGPQAGDRTLALLIFILAWIVFGLVWLIRLVPRFREPPKWLMRRLGALDIVLLAIIVVALGYALLA